VGRRFSFLRSQSFEFLLLGCGQQCQV
jgi:hypothetical protein